MRVAGRVLVVDDDRAYLPVVIDALRDEGYSVDAATSAGAALDHLWAAWHDQPEVILLDLGLPMVDGRTFTESYRLLPIRHAPIILMSGSSKAQEVAREIDARDVLHKPFHLDELLERLHRATRATAA